MRFTTYIPCNELKPFIRSFAVSEAEEEQTYKVLPGTALVIGFQFKGRISLANDDEQIQLSRSGITGLHDRFRLFRNAADTGTVLVYFNETGAAQFFHQPMHELFLESVSLEHFMLRSELLIIEERLYEAKNDADRIAVIEEFLLSRLKHPAQDPLVLMALTIIHQRRGDIRIRELAKELHTSQSPLEKRFRSIVGASPKKFAAIVRMKHAIELYAHGKTLTALAYEGGFYDQSHFIKEFRNFTGNTPEIFFSSR